ncbi:MAG TPA: peptidase M28, partial [Thermoanaerobaculia bacterium]|nr:peptidase M28 [Thermoanaerobaculia bacterium]
MKRSAVGMLLFLLAAGPAVRGAPPSGPAPITAEEKRAAEEITPQVIAAHTKFLASDLLEGRGPSTRGDRLAMEYVASQMEA